MKKKLLFAPIITLSCLVASCWSGGNGDNSWSQSIKQAMQQEFGIVIPYVKGLDSPEVHFRDNGVLTVSDYFDDFDSALSFVLSYQTLLYKNGFEGGYSTTDDSVYMTYSHSTDKTIVVSEETISELLWVDLNVDTLNGGEDYTLDLIAYLSGDFATFPLDSLCELIGVSDTYKSSIPTFATAPDTHFKIKGYVPGDTYTYVIAHDTSGCEIFNQYTQDLRDAGFEVHLYGDDLMATGAKHVDGLGNIGVHYYETGYNLFGGYVITG